MSNEIVYNVKGHRFPQWRDYVGETVMVRFRLLSWCVAEIESEWLNEYRNKLHPNDEVTNMDLSTYAHYYFDIEELYRDEVPNVIDDALEAGVVGYLD
jgi:hypothetical protein